MNLLADSIEEKTVCDFSQNWLKYDENYETYLPVLEKELKEGKSLHQIISVEKYNSCQLVFKATKGLVLFVNNKLVYKKISRGEEEISLNISDIVPYKSGDVIFTFYNSDKILPVNTAAIKHKYIKKATGISHESKNNYLVMLRNVQDNFSDFMILFLLIVTAFVLFKKLYPKEFIRYYAFKVQENMDHLLIGTFSIPSLWMIFMNGLALSLLMSMLRFNKIIFTTPLSIFQTTIASIVIYFIFFTIRYLYISVIAWLFNYSKIASAQCAEFIRLFERIILLVTVVVFGLIMSGVQKIEINPKILYFSLIVILVLCIVKVIFLFFRVVSHRNLYLFSYLCAAEILPLIIAVKILLF
ncbi:MAG TPA: DUF4271 domain-containing protein [Cytophagaceae bacterium]|nr:DUF4271 domain-containing protein [Cytophagaceae bacterium]